MGCVESETVQKEFEELLSAYWVAQLTQLRADPDSTTTTTSSQDRDNTRETGK